MKNQFTFKTYAWSLGTTSFRMADFHKKVETQLKLLEEFWNLSDNLMAEWGTTDYETGTKTTQVAYYDFLYSKGFLTGQIQDDFGKKAKTARQKTSGLVDIGLIFENRKLTDVGKKLLNISTNGDFSTDNDFKIPRDSYIYLKQLIKTSNKIGGSFVRPYLVTGKLLQEFDGSIAEEEFTYLLPLCINEESTDKIIKGIKSYREGRTTIDDIIIDVVLSRYDYPYAKSYFLNESEKTPDVIMSIGMNRDGARHDLCYVDLYYQLKSLYIDKSSSVPNLVKALKAIKNDKPRSFWNSLLLDKSKSKKNPTLSSNRFDAVKSNQEFDECFFNYLHLFKIKSTLSDYRDLNRRYLSITDSIIFGDHGITFAPLFIYYFKTDARKVFDDAFVECKLLNHDCSLTEINSHLKFESQSIIDSFNDFNKPITVDSIEEIYKYVEDERYKRFNNLIDSKFPNSVVVSLLDKLEDRNQSFDTDLMNLVGNGADVPTIFEYLVAIIWYRISDHQGKILDYMNLSLDADLLPRTHAGGGVSDIVYKYPKSDDYPEHSLLIECTLMEGTNQRHGEMEPVSRHLANYLIDQDDKAYCSFISNDIHTSVMSDFRARKNSAFYRNDTDHVDTMKIIPLETKDLKIVIEKDIHYSQLYKIFENAYYSDEKNVPKWYKECIEEKLSFD